MFKTFLICVLGISLLVAAFVTRPSEQSTIAFLANGHQPTAAAPQTVADTVKDAIVKSVDLGEKGVPSEYEFKDRVLWVEVQKNGQTVYTGVLSHWFKHAPPPPLSSPTGDTKLASAK